MLLSGDTHHYSRYAAKDRTQFVTSGGGGAFRHPTRHIANEAALAWFACIACTRLYQGCIAGHLSVRHRSKP